MKGWASSNKDASINPFANVLFFRFTSWTRENPLKDKQIVYV